MRWPKWGLAAIVALAGVAFWLLLAGPEAVFGIVVTLGITPADRLAWATPVAVAHLLVFTLVWHCLVEYFVTAVSYWRDRRP